MCTQLVKDYGPETVKRAVSGDCCHGIFVKFQHSSIELNSTQTHGAQEGDTLQDEKKFGLQTVEDFGSSFRGVTHETVENKC